MSNHAGDVDAPDPASKPAESVPGISESKPASSSVQRPKTGLALVLGSVLLIVLAGAVVSHWPAFTVTQPQQTSPSVADRTLNQNATESTEVLRHELAALTAQLQATEARIGSTDQTAQRNTVSSADLATRLAGVDARIDALENRVVQAADKGVQRDLQERLARLESGSSAEGTRRAANALGFALLVRAASEAQSFKEELDALSALAPADPSVAALGPYAAQGVPTLAMLRARFPEAARAGLDAERSSNSGTGILAQLWARLTGLVRVRRVGDVAGNSSADHLARAEADLGRADLAGATVETRTLTGAAGSAMASWLKDAQARIVVDRALADMDLRIVQALVTPVPQPESGSPPGSRRP